MVLQCLEKLRNWEIQESHKNDKLDIVTFKLIGLKLHTSGRSQPNMNRSILIKTYSVAIPAFSGTSPPLSVSAEGFVSLSFKINSACFSVCEVQFLTPQTELGFHISLLRGSSLPRDGTCVSCIFCIGKQILYQLCHLAAPHSS